MTADDLSNRLYDLGQEVSRFRDETDDAGELALLYCETLDLYADLGVVLRSLPVAAVHANAGL